MQIYSDYFPLNIIPLLRFLCKKRSPLFPNNNCSNQQQGRIGNRKFFKPPCQKCGLRNHSAKWASKSL
uniref:Uncharacterized protein n=1 Tax=Salix viminalis TaxID=40686 RepID=A0A6N2M7U5_SALVM